MSALCEHGIPTEHKPWAYYEITITECPYCIIDELEEELIRARRSYNILADQYDDLLEKYNKITKIS